MDLKDDENDWEYPGKLSNEMIVLTRAGHAPIFCSAPMYQHILLHINTFGSNTNMPNLRPIIINSEISSNKKYIL